jgi:hypothetical protein
LELFLFAPTTTKQTKEKKNTSLTGSKSGKEHSSTTLGLGETKHPPLETSGMTKTTLA